MSNNNKTRAEIYKSNINSDNDPRRYCIDWIKENSKVLDIGCACGDFAYQLKKEKQCIIYGIEYNRESINIAEKTDAFEKILQTDLNTCTQEDLNNFAQDFDYIVFGDILEHLYDPIEVVKRIKTLLKPNGKVLISLPNIAHASIKANLLLNNFEYTDSGLLDKTHIRFFTSKTAAKFLTDLNLKIEDYKYTNWCGKCGTQPNNPYKELPFYIKHFILKDKYSKVVQFVFNCSVQKNFSSYNENFDVIEKYTK